MAGLVWFTLDLIVEHGEVECQTETNGMGRLHFILGQIVCFIVGLRGLLYNVCVCVCVEWGVTYTWTIKIKSRIQNTQWGNQWQCQVKLGVGGEQVTHLTSHRLLQLQQGICSNRPSSWDRRLKTQAYQHLGWDDRLTVSTEEKYNSTVYESTATRYLTTHDYTTPFQPQSYWMVLWNIHMIAFLRAHPCRCLEALLQSFPGSFLPAHVLVLLQLSSAQYWRWSARHYAVPQPHFCRQQRGDSVHLLWVSFSPLLLVSWTVCVEYRMEWSLTSTEWTFLARGIIPSIFGMIVIYQALPVIYRIPYKDKMVSVAINFHCKDKCCSLHKPQTK